MFVRTKDFTIYVPVNIAVTIVVAREEPELDGQEDFLADEREQMLDDYD
jgi:hypothetical protein